MTRPLTIVSDGLEWWLPLLLVPVLAVVAMPLVGSPSSWVTLTVAGLAMGLTQLQVYRYVLIPVAYRTIIPPLTSDFLGVFKNSSLALTIGVLELTSQARQIEEYTFAAFEAFTVATVLYCLVTGLVILIMRIVESRTRIAGAITVGAQ